MIRNRLLVQTLVLDKLFLILSVWLPVFESTDLLKLRNYSIFLLSSSPDHVRVTDED